MNKRLVVSEGESFCFLALSGVNSTCQKHPPCPVYLYLPSAWAGPPPLVALHTRKQIDTRRSWWSGCP